MDSRHILALSPARASIRSAHPNLGRQISLTPTRYDLVFSLSLSLSLSAPHFHGLTSSFFHFPLSLSLSLSHSHFLSFVHRSPILPSRFRSSSVQ